MHPFTQTFSCDTETPVSLFARLAAGEPYAFLLESAETHEKIGRYSVLGLGVEKILRFPAAVRENPLHVLQKAAADFAYEPNPALPRFQAPLTGYITYEAARHFEHVELPAGDPAIPEAIFSLPRALLVIDHHERTVTAIAYRQATFDALIDAFLQKHRASPPIASINLAPHDVFSKTAAPGTAHFPTLVEKSKTYIRAGEVFQIVISQEFCKKTAAAPFDLYRRLRRIAPSPYMYFLKYPEFSIVGSSPETLVRTEAGEVVLKPIAGTRRRGKTFDEETRFERELMTSEKEQAEHMMLVDLGRNDVGRVAVPGTVRVTECMKLVKFSHVMHLVSEIRGSIRPDATMFDVFRAAFPAGTLTGAPKIRAMERIAELEKTPRGIYGGAVGYFDLSGEMDFAIAIRTMICRNGEVRLRAGAGLVLDSDPAQENLECHNKARGPLSAVV